VNYEQIIFFRNFLFRAFIIGIAFAVFYFIATYVWWSTWASWVTCLFKIDEKEFGRLALMFFLNMRIVLVFFFLVPTLALHWMARIKQRADLLNR